MLTHSLLDECPSAFNEQEEDEALCLVRIAVPPKASRTLVGDQEGKNKVEKAQRPRTRSLSFSRFRLEIGEVKSAGQKVLRRMLNGFGSSERKRRKASRHDGKDPQEWFGEDEGEEPTLHSQLLWRQLSTSRGLLDWHCGPSTGIYTIYQEEEETRKHDRSFHVYRS